MTDGFQDDAESERRDAIVARAASQLGPQNPDKYWDVVCPELMGLPTKIAWCGGFSLWCLRETPDACEWPGGKPWNWQIGKGFASRLPQTLKPLPGDIAYIEKPYQHHAIVERVEGGAVHTIDGNQQPGESVARRVRPRHAFSAFFSIGPLVRRNEAEPELREPDELEQTKPDLDLKV